MAQKEYDLRIAQIRDYETSTKFQPSLSLYDILAAVSSITVEPFLHGIMTIVAIRVYPYPQHSSSSNARIWYQIPQREIIHNILNFLDVIFDAVTSPSQRIILEVQNLEASVEVLDELTDL